MSGRSIQNSPYGAAIRIFVAIAAAKSTALAQRSSTEPDSPRRIEVVGMAPRATQIFKELQIPAVAIPRINVNPSDWAMVPESYSIGRTRMHDGERKRAQPALKELEPQFQKIIDAYWSLKVLDINRRLVTFEDESVGKISNWRWDFGDDTRSVEQHPLHVCGKAAV